jgi:hypothetical protein
MAKTQDPIIATAPAPRKTKRSYRLPTEKERQRRDDWNKRVDPKTAEHVVKELNKSARKQRDENDRAMRERHREQDKLLEQQKRKPKSFASIDVNAVYRERNEHPEGAPIAKRATSRLTFGELTLRYYEDQR